MIKWTVTGSRYIGSKLLSSISITNTTSTSTTIALVATNYGFPYVFPMVDYGGHYGAMVLLWFAYGSNHRIP